MSDLARESVTLVGFAGLLFYYDARLAVLCMTGAPLAVFPLVRLGRVAQFGEMPTFITELGREVERPLPERMRVGGPLAAIARDHARRREALGFAPREGVTEFLLLRRVLWRFVAGRLTGLESGDVNACDTFSAAQL